MTGKTILTLTLLIVGVILVTGATTAFAGGYFGKSEEVQSALESGDFDEWKRAMDDWHNERMATITEEDFQNMQEHHGKMMMHHQAKMEEMEAVHAALEAKDYKAWLAATEDQEGFGCQMHEQVTEENFEQFADIHIAKMNGDWETATQIAEDIGLEFGHKGFRKMHHWR